MPNIIYQPLKTPKGCYIYDRNVNTIFSVSENEYKELKLFCGKDNAEQSAAVQHYRQKGLLLDSDVEMIRHPSTEALPHYCSNCLSSLILQVTQQCNLRCSYCAYSGAYYNRTHNEARMSFETAKRAIDFFLARTSESQDVHLGFYGGEPLLEFELIKKCVAYIKSAVEGKKITFGITTNATLLTDEKIKFLHDNQFGLTISLDGSKQEHDSCRVFPDGSGSFDIVVQNIQRIKAMYPDYARELIVSTVISPKADLNNMLEYFKSDEVFSDTYMIMTPVAESGLKEPVNYKESFHVVRRYEYLKFLLFMIGKLDKSHVSKLVYYSKKNLETLYRILQKHTQIPKCMHHNGPCVPSVKRLFVMTDGRFFPCEKVGESLSCFQIGSLDTGFDLENMEKLLNLGSITVDECKKCWALSHCKICAAEIDYQDGQAEFRKADKLKACEKAKRLVMSDLYEMCVLHEFGYRLNEEDIIL